MLAPGTAERYARNLELFLRWLKAREGARARLHPDLLTQTLVEEFYHDLAGNGRHGRPRTAPTRRKIVEVLQLAWEWAAGRDDLGPLVPRPARIEMLPRVPVLTVAPTWAEMDAVVGAFDPDAWHRKLAILLRFTGLRVQQAMSLLWVDFDLDRQTLHVRGELGKSRQEKRGRIVPVSAHLLEIMSGWGRREAYVITSNRKGRRERLARPRDMRRAWERAGVREAAWRGRPHHAFRKGFVSGLRAEGADPDAVEVLVGHSLGLKGVYTDPDSLALRATIEKIPALGGAGEIVSLDVHRHQK